MAGYESHDGKLAGNRQLVERYDESKGKRSKHMGPQRPHEKGGASGGEHDPGGHDEIKQVVAEHGPAHTHIITAKHHGGMPHGGGGHASQEPYHSETHHEDGHVHHEDHASIEEAHEHGAHAFDDADHLGDMPRDDEKVAMEEDRAERFPSHRTEDIGFMK